MKLNPSPEFFYTIRVVMNHRFDEWPAHRVSKNSLAKDCLLELLADFFERIDVRAFLSRFQVERVADQAKVFDCIKPCGARLIEEDRSDFSRDDL